MKIGRKEGWEVSLTGFNVGDVGITPEQLPMFDQILAWKTKGMKGKPVINFILIYNGTEELTLTEFANTPIGTEIRTPKVDGIFCYYHEAKSSPASADDWAILPKDVDLSSIITMQEQITDLQGKVRPYKVYTALLSQSGTNAPVATVSENTIGNIVWSRQGQGIYHATLNNGFPEGKTVITPEYINYIGMFEESVLYVIPRRNYRLNTNVIEVFTSPVQAEGNQLLFGVSLDGYHNISPFEIRVYP